MCTAARVTRATQAGKGHGRHGRLEPAGAGTGGTGRHGPAWAGKGWQIISAPKPTLTLIACEVCPWQPSNNPNPLFFIQSLPDPLFFIQTLLRPLFFIQTLLRPLFFIQPLPFFRTGTE